MLDAVKRWFYEILLRVERREIADSEQERADCLAAGRQDEASALESWINECKGHVAAYETRLSQLK